MIFILISRQFIMSTAERKLELDLMRGYEESFKLRMMKVVSLSYECLPVNGEQYTLLVSELMQCMKSIDPNQKDLSAHDEIILGKIQGQPASTNFKQLIQSMVGEISELKFKAFLKQKTQQKNYGLNVKDKNCSVRQVKKIQSLKKYFDVNQINKKRKYNRLYSAATKSLAKYFEHYNKINEADPQTIQQAFEHYNNYTKEQKKFNNYVRQLDTVQPQNVVEKPVIVEEQILVQKEQVAIEQEHKIEQEVKQVKKIEEQKKQPQQKDNVTPKKSKGKKKEAKPEDGIITEKEKCESDEKKKEEKDKKEEKEKALKKQKQEKQKTAKKNTNRSLTEFFVVKKKDPQATKKTATEEEVNHISSQQNDEQLAVAQIETPKPSIWSTLSQQTQSSRIEMKDLRSQFRSLKMQNQQYHPEPYYTNIVITLSTLQYYDYPMTVPKTVNFSKPFEKIYEVFYFEDESEEFEGESANEEAEEQEEADESELSVGNNTILDDDHLSNEQLSSCEPYEVDLKVEYGKATKWVFGFANRGTSMHSQDQMQIIIDFSMICLESDQQMPLKLQEQEEIVQIVMTPELWREVYKIAHGYHGTKDAIIKDISVILPGISKTWIDTMLKQRSEKVLNQRFIKKDFIDDIKEKIPEIDSILENILSERNEELRKIKAQKNQQKDQKLQKDILECTGSRYIVNLLKQLKQKGYKQLRRNQLIEFINQRKGDQWQKIMAEMNTMSRPIVEMIKNMPASEKIDEEVVVQDDQYNNVPEEGKPKAERSNVSTQEKIEIMQIKEGKEGKKGSKNEKQTKQKKRKSKSEQKSLSSTYEKTKQISRARKTKNSLKTGIVSIEELKKQKEEQKLKEQQGGEKLEVEQQADDREQRSEQQGGGQQAVDEINEQQSENDENNQQENHLEESVEEEEIDENHQSEENKQGNSDEQAPQSISVKPLQLQQKIQIQISPVSQEDQSIEKSQPQAENVPQALNIPSTLQSKCEATLEDQAVTLNNIQLP